MSKPQSKVCPRCGEEKPLTEFQTQRTSKDGRATKCKLCTSLPPDDIDVDQFVAETFELSNDQLAEKYDRSQRMVEAWKTSLRKVGYELGTIKTWHRRHFHNKIEINDVGPPAWPEVEDAGFPESLTADFNKFEVLEREKCMVFGDAEVPDHDRRLFNIVYRVAERYGISSAIINGDFWAMHSFSKWGRHQPERYQFMRDELEPSTEILRVFHKQFEDILMVEGNHERWLNKQLDGHFNVSVFLEGLMGVRYSQYGFMVLRSGGEEILVGHPKNFRKKPGSLPLELATIHLMNVLIGHVHRMSFQIHPSGRFWAVEGGHCRDTSKTAYKNLSLTTHGQWNCGAVMIIDGWPHLLTPQTFDFYMGKHNDIEKKRKAGPTDEEIEEMEKAKAALESFREKYNDQ